MKKFMGKNFLLESDTAQHLYHDFAAQMPIIDYHCHINPQEIAEDRKFENITQVWLGGDHYKWRLMRACGVDERYITGDASDREKFQKFAETLPKAIGNPVYHWSHLELQRFFGYHGALTGDTAEEVWNLCNAKLAEDSMSVRNLIRQSNVEIICTTDDPVDDLRWHKKLADDPQVDFKVYPAWRPDKAMNIEKPEFMEYVAKLAEVSGVKITSFATLVEALKNRLEFFDSMKCCVSDHGINYVVCLPATEEEIEKIFEKKAAGETLTQLEVDQYKSAFMIAMGREYHRLGWVMQLHYGTNRNVNDRFYEKLGPDTGFDCINNDAAAAQLASFLNALSSTDQLPKTIVYSLNPADNAIIDTICGSFQDSTAVQKVQHGSAWWFNDHKTGMEEQLTSFANLSVLGNFVGMLTDSRSFLSYTRHEYFRRILCNVLGNWVESGQYPYDEKALKAIVEGISYNNAKNYFNFR